MMPFSSRCTPELLRAGLDWHLRHTITVSKLKESDRDWYYAFSMALRDQLVDSWMLKLLYGISRISMTSLKLVCLLQITLNGL